MIKAIFLFLLLTTVTIYGDDSPIKHYFLIGLELGLDEIHFKELPYRMLAIDRSGDVGTLIAAGISFGYGLKNVGFLFRYNGAGPGGYQKHLKKEVNDDFPFDSANKDNLSLITSYRFSDINRLTFSGLSGLQYSHRHRRSDRPHR